MSHDALDAQAAFDLSNPFQNIPTYHPMPHPTTHTDCNQLPTCQSFTYVRPVAGQPGTWGQMNCLFYEGNPGSSNSTYTRAHAGTDGWIDRWTREPLARVGLWSMGSDPRAPVQSPLEQP